MTMQISAAVANNMLDGIDAQGASCLFQVWSGAPVAPESAPAGVKLVEMALPDPFLAPAAAGVKAKVGTWQGIAITDGTAGSYRFVNGSGVGFSTGTIGAVGSGADAEIDSVTIFSGQTIAVSTFNFKFPGF